MLIVPVMDLKQGLVVRGIAGRREAYRPVRSCLCSTADPGDVARALVRRLRRADVYVADLDAIAGGEPAWSSWQAISAAGLRLWVDAGIRGVADAERLVAAAKNGLGPPIDRLIVGLESAAGPAALGAVVRSWGPERVALSLDLYGGQPRADCPAWRDQPPMRIVRQAAGLGIRRFIVLDLSRVGTGQGVGTLPLCRQMRADLGGVEITAGGGVSSPADLAELAEVGIDAALVASALHDGRIGRADVEDVERGS
jgi:phosphoribosylformimino-5-aminoimidazole carboxamide ribotide isomerase